MARLKDESVVGAYELKTHVAELLDRVEKGEVILITRHGRLVARLVPYSVESQRHALEAARALKEFRASMPKVSAKELRKARHAGHKY